MLETNKFAGYLKAISDSINKKPVDSLSEPYSNVELYLKEIADGISDFIAAQPTIATVIIDKRTGPAVTFQDPTYIDFGYRVQLFELSNEKSFEFKIIADKMKIIQKSATTDPILQIYNDKGQAFSPDAEVTIQPDTVYHITIQLE